MYKEEIDITEFFRTWFELKTITKGIVKEIEEKQKAKDRANREKRALLRHNTTNPNQTRTSLVGGETPQDYSVVEEIGWPSKEKED